MTNDIIREWQEDLDARQWRNIAAASTVERDRLARELADSQAQLQAAQRQAQDAGNASSERDALFWLVVVIVVLFGLAVFCGGLAVVNTPGVAG